MSADIEKLYINYAREINIHAEKLTGDPHDGEELTQEAFLRVIESTAKGNTILEEKSKALLYKVVTNLFLDRVRRKKIIQFVGEESLGVLGTQDITPQATIRRATKEVIDDCLQRITGNQRLAIEMFYFGNLSYEQISEAMGIPINSVRSLLFRAKQSLANDPDIIEIA